MGEIVGYARTSTVEQDAGLEAQLRDLRAAGCTRTFAEKVSSVAPRMKLTEALGWVRSGDILIVTKIDRLARSLTELLRIAEDLERRGIELRVLATPALTGPTGKLMLSVIGAVAEFERAIMLERQREGIASAKAAGRYKGRAPTARRQRDQIQKLAADGLTKAKIAAELGISERSVFRVLSKGGRQLTQTCENTSLSPASAGCATTRLPV
jgi:DNA invertase Pin-like site-specific DNA recombinase